MTWRKKLLFGIATTLLFFLLLELALTAIGVQANSTSDALVGFSKQDPLLQISPNADGSQQAHTALGKLVWFNAQSFPAKKPTNTKRIFCVGGSTTFGRPFDDATSYSGWLREFLPAVAPETNWEVINAGGVSYASYRVAAVMEELAAYEPDIFIVYSVHNEFLERRTYEGMFDRPQWNHDLNAVLQRTRTWSLVQRIVAAKPTVPQPVEEMFAPEVDEMLNHSIGPRQYHRDPSWSEGVLRHYELNLQRMIDIAEESGAKIVFITPTSNLRDCWPFKSEFSASVDDVTKLQWNNQLNTAAAAIQRQEFETALTICDEILPLEPQHAYLHFIRGKALFGLDRFEEAEIAFQQAVDEDVCPLRATSRIAAAVRLVAKRRDRPVVDFDARLRQHSKQQFGHTCFGGDYFLDHVHPTIDVHRDLAKWILDQLQTEQWVTGTALTNEAIQATETKIHSGIDIETQCLAYRNLAKVLHWSGKFEEAIPRAQDALDMIPEDLESRFVLADSMVNSGYYEEAMGQYQTLFTIGDFPRAYLPYGEFLLDHGDLKEAEKYLTLATITDQVHQARAFYSLGRAYLALKDYKAAAEALRITDELYPNDPSTLEMLEEIKRLQEQ
ncbi:MAG: tetratricopeptide repeat protein [Rubripirellula sp.]